MESLDRLASGFSSGSSSLEIPMRSSRSSSATKDVSSSSCGDSNVTLSVPWMRYRTFGSRPGEREVCSVRLTLFERGSTVSPMERSSMASAAKCARRQFEQERHGKGATVATGAGATLEAAELVHFALSRISPEHREVLTLRFLEEMKIEEIAEAIDCPVGTVKSRLHYASREIQSVIEEQENGGK